jgi:transcription antitermination factor NusG
MTLWIAYTARGREFDTAEEAETLGLWAIVPRKVELIRQGKRRRPDAITSPYLDNYVFTEADAQGWHWLRASKHVRTIMAVPEAERAAVMRFIDRVEADYAARMAQIEAGERVSQYSPGDLLEIITGPFAGTIAAFRRVAESASMFPELVVEQTIFGREVTTRVDPLAVRLVTA